MTGDSYRLAYLVALRSLKTTSAWVEPLSRDSVIRASETRDKWLDAAPEGRCESC